MKPLVTQVGADLLPYMRIGGERGGIYPLLRVQKNVTGQRFLED